MKLSRLSALLAALLAPTAKSALTEKEILTHLYHNLNGDSWTQPWDLTAAPCTYAGVVCANNRVVEISLSDNNLQGSISPHLYALEKLERVDFSKNGIYNAGWDRITDLGSSSSGGTVVSPLKVMDLTSNRIHSLEGVENLKETLTGLHMTYNNLKSWQDELFELKGLSVLAVSENEIGGKVDKRLGGLVGLKELYCYGNVLTGTIRKFRAHALMDCCC